MFAFCWSKNETVDSVCTIINRGKKPKADTAAQSVVNIAVSIVANIAMRKAINTAAEISMNIAAKSDVNMCIKAREYRRDERHEY